MIEAGNVTLHQYRTARAVFWRRENADGEIECVPIVRWEILDYVPFEVQDFPDDDR